jgi:hypothetical protein
MEGEGIEKKPMMRAARMDLDGVFMVRCAWR